MTITMISIGVVFVGVVTQGAGALPWLVCPNWAIAVSTFAILELNFYQAVFITFTAGLFNDFFTAYHPGSTPMIILLLLPLERYLGGMVLLNKRLKLMIFSLANVLLYFTGLVILPGVYPVENGINISILALTTTLWTPVIRNVILSTLKLSKRRRI